MIDIRQWMSDPQLLGGHFGGESFDAWRALLGGFDGLALTADEARTFEALTRRAPPTEALDELWMVIGRRGGKSQAAGLIATVAGATFDRQHLLAPGEVATVMVIAEDRKQARAVYRYVTGLLESNPMLARLITRNTAEGIELSTRVCIEIHTASFRAVRGYTLLLAILDEIALWFSDGANPDAEILSALRPGLGTLGGRLVALSSPYARRGVLWNAYRKHHGQADSRILVAQAPTTKLNPTFPQATIDAALEDDPARARAEYLAEFRTDVETFVSREAVEACVAPGVREIPPIQGVRYVAFVDPSGGSADSMTLAIAHKEGERGVLDATRERKPPFSPEAVVAEHAELLKRYNITSVTGDRYAGEWPRERYRVHGISYVPAERTRSELYQALLPAINSQQAELLDDKHLVNQLVSLERRTSRGGRDTIDHPPSGHDDVANAVAGAVWLAIGKTRPTWGVAKSAVADEPLTITARQAAAMGAERARGYEVVRDPADDPTWWTA